VKKRAWCNLKVIKT